MSRFPPSWSDSSSSGAKAISNLLSESATNVRYRDDIQFVTPAADPSSATATPGVQYLNGSISVFGNGGSQSLQGNSVNNPAANPGALADLSNASAVLTAETTTTDHLPVVADYMVVSSNANPTIGAFAVSPASAPSGTNVTLTASNVVAQAGGISAVKFYRETNGTNGLQIGSDALIGGGTQNGTTWTIGDSTSGLAAGNYVYYAVATDSNGNSSPTSSTTLNVTSVPSIGSLNVSPTSVTSGATVSLTANAVTDFGSSVNAVKFYLESNGTSGLQIGSDTLLGSGTQTGINWMLGGMSTSGFAAGTFTLYAIASDSTGASSAVASTTLAVVPPLPAWLSVSNPNQVNWNLSAQTLEVMSGTATIVADPNETQFNGGAGDEPVITVDNGATLAIAPTDGSLIVHIGGLTLNSGATGDVKQLKAPAAADQAAGNFVASDDASNHEVLVVGMLGAASDPTFSINPNSTLNLENNDLIVHTGSSDANGYTDLATTQGLAYGIGGGRDGGLWDGKGLASTVAKNQDASDGGESVQLAVADNADLAFPFSSYTVGNASEGIGRSDVIVKYTYTGDFNLDGKVDASDYNIFAIHYDAAGSGGNEWAFGDTNDDGLLDAGDYNNLALDFGNGTAAGNDTVQL